MISMIYETGATDLMEVAFANVERATAVMKDYATKTGKELKVTPESIVKRSKVGASSLLRLRCRL
jgi:hypothetical protein